MKKYLIALFTVICGFSYSQNKELSNLERKFDFSMISRGDNVADFSVRQDSIKFLLIYLHENLPLSKFQKDFKISDETLKKTIAFLNSKNWLTENNGKLKPTVFIATAADGKKLYKYAKPISNEIAEAIKKYLPTVKTEFAATSMSKNQNFECWSLFVLSDVLLDNGNIFPMESSFFKRKDGSLYDRPLRHGKHYYASYQENTEKNSEAFGIFGNQGLKFTDSLQVWVYGNNRRNGFYDNFETSENKMYPQDYGIFDKMAQNFLPELLKILEKNRNYAEKIYKKTGYSQEITFEEFFIWWYHFIYSQATEEMQKQGMLEIPPSGNFDYEILN